MARQNNEAKIRFTADTKDFTAAVQDADRNMSSLRAELKRHETQMKATGTTVEGLETKHQLLNRQYEESERKVTALQGKVDAATRIFGANSAEAQNWTTKLVEAQARAMRLGQAVQKSNEELEAFKAAEAKANSATTKLTDTIAKQQAEVDDLKEEYAEAVLQYGKNSDEAKDLAKKLKSLSGELDDNKSKLDGAKKAADKLDRSLDDAGDSARDAEGGFTVMKGAIADLVSEGIQFGISKISEFIDYIKELPEATRELRQDMATLDTSFETAGLSGEQATQMWKELYTVFGEEDRAVEAANLIAKMSKNQKDLNSWVTITKGVWGSYQDSLPVEGLAEASNETAKTGKVTGVLADALNWSGEAASMFSKYMGEDVTTAEDAFNEALKDCSNEQERQKLIVDTLTKLYGDAAKTYEEASGAQIAEKEAAAEALIAQNNLAAAVAPATTAWSNLKTEILTGITPAIEGICGHLSTAFQWLQKHPAAMTAVAAAVAALGAALTVLAGALAIATIKQWLMNSAVLANPITWIVVGIVAAVAALIAIGVALYKNWDKVSAGFVSAWESVKNAWGACADFFKGLGAGIVNGFKAAWEWIQGAFSSVGSWINTNVIQPVVNFFTGLWDSVVNIWNNIVNGVKVAVMFIGSILSAAWTIITTPFRMIWENCKQYVFAAWEGIKNAVSTAINAVKNIITVGMTAVRNFLSPILNAIKNAFTTAWNGIKTAWSACVAFFRNIWNGISNAFSSVGSWFREKFNAAKQGVTNAWAGVKGWFSNIWSGIKNTFANVGGWFREKFNAAKQGVTNAWSSVTGFFSRIFSKIKSTFAKVKDAIVSPFKTAIDKVKNFFSGLKLNFPKIKMPHFSISGKFSLKPPSVPKLKVQYYDKGAILTKPTVFGMNGLNPMVGGETKPEAIVRIDKLQGYIAEEIEKHSQTAGLIALAEAIEDLANRPIGLSINGRQFATATAGDADSVNGIRSKLTERGLIL